MKILLIRPTQTAIVNIAPILCACTLNVWCNVIVTNVLFVYELKKPRQF